MTVDERQFPALAKMESVQDESQVIGGFLEWLQENGMTICAPTDGLRGSQFWPVSENTEKLLARYFDVDLVAAENERRKILATLNQPVAA